MLNEEFCLHLEYATCRAFRHSGKEHLQGFWCDGVLTPFTEGDKLRKEINDKREIITVMFTSESGQEAYELILLFGTKSLSRNAKGLDLLECIPVEESDHWFEVDLEQKRVTIQLL